MNEQVIEIRIACIRQGRSLKELWVEYCREKREIPYDTFRSYTSQTRRPPEGFIGDCMAIAKGWQKPD